MSCQSVCEAVTIGFDGVTCPCTECTKWINCRVPNGCPAPSPLPIIECDGEFHSGDEQALAIALPVILIGVLICYMCWLNGHRRRLAAFDAESGEIVLNRPPTKRGLVLVAWYGASFAGGITLLALGGAANGAAAGAVDYGPRWLRLTAIFTGLALTLLAIARFGVLLCCRSGTPLGVGGAQASRAALSASALCVCDAACDSCCDVPASLIPIDQSAHGVTLSPGAARWARRFDNGTLVAGAGSGVCGCTGCIGGVCCGSPTGLKLVLYAVPFTILFFYWFVAGIAWIVFVFRTCGGPRGTPARDEADDGAGDDRIPSVTRRTGEVPTVIDMPPELIEMDNTPHSSVPSAVAVADGGAITSDKPSTGGGASSGGGGYERVQQTDNHSADAL